MFSDFFVPNKSNGYYPYSIRKSALTIYVVILILINVFGSIFIPGFATEVSASTITPGNIIALTNAERQAASLTTLSNDARLAAAAQAKANDMFQKDYWDHFGPNGETPWQFISAAGYSYIYAGENLAKGFSTAEGVHQAWMASPTHKANIMNGNYRDIGVAVAEGELGGENVILVVQMFGSLTNDPPPQPTPTPPPEPTTQPTQESTTPLPKEEKGEIKSISIVKPVEDDIVTDPAVDVEGTVEGYQSNIGSYSVVVKREGEEIGSTTATSENWVFDKESDWTEGEQKVEVYLKDKIDLKDSILFTVDSKAPSVDDNAISILLDGNHAEINVALEEKDAEVYLSFGGETYSFTHQGDGVYTAFVPEFLVTSGNVRGVLIVSDSNGNSQEVDLTDQIANVIDTGNLAPVSDPTLLQQVLSGFTSMTLKGKVNLFFGIFILALLTVAIIFFIRKRMLREKGGYLMTVGIFFFIILVGLFTEVSGNIN